MEVIRNGSNIWISVPSFNIYSRAMTTNALSETIREAGRWINTDLDATAYRLIASSAPDVMLARAVGGPHGRTGDVDVLQASAEHSTNDKQSRAMAEGVKADDRPVAAMHCRLRWLDSCGHLPCAFVVGRFRRLPTDE